MTDRVAVVGNCQAPSIAHVLTKTIPGTTFKCFALPLLKTPEARSAAADKLIEYDVVLSQELTSANLGPLVTSEIQARHPNVILYPQIRFNGYYPDFFLLRHNGKNIRSAAENYHSLIAAAAFANRLPLERVGALFNAFNFSRLGYFEEYSKARSYLLSHAMKFGFDLEDDFAKWQQEGAFMYTHNHPAMRVLLTIAAKTAAKAGIDFPPASAGEFRDQLARAETLPVYPDIARRIGVPASTTFKRSQMRGREGTVIDMDTFIRQSYALYESLPPEVFEQPRIQDVATILRSEMK